MRERQEMGDEREGALLEIELTICTRRVLESLPVRTCTNILFGQNMNTYKRAMRKKGL